MGPSPRSRALRWVSGRKTLVLGRLSGVFQRFSQVFKRCRATPDLKNGHSCCRGVFVGVTTVDFTDIVMREAGPPSAYTGPALTTAICSNRVA